MTTADATTTVNTWFTERLANGPLARDTPAYNQVVAALPDLIARLSPSPLDAPAPEPQADPAAEPGASA